MSAAAAPFNVAADAITAGSTDVVKQLLEQNPSLPLEEEVYDEAMETTGNDSIAMAPIIGSLLNLAAKYGRLEVAKMLLEAGAEVNHLETTHWHEAAQDSRSALYAAVWAGDAPMVSLLVDHGVEVGRVSGPPATAKTPLEEAVYSGYTEIVQRLLDAGADAAPKCSSTDLLPRAIQGQHVDIVKLLVEREANVNAVTTDGGLCPLEMAVSRNSPDIVQLLMEKGAKAGADGSGDGSLMAITSKAQANWEEYVEKAAPGLEKAHRASMADQHQQLIKILLDKSALTTAPGGLEHVMALFKQFDKDGDGVISRAELKLVLQLLDQDSWTEERIDQLLSAADMNHDGKIQFSEFAAWAFGS